MPSSRRNAGAIALALLALVAQARNARAETRSAEGFGVERLVLAAPSGRWLVLDDLSMHGKLGGAVALTGGYSHDALRVTSTVGRDVAVVRHQAAFGLGFAVTLARYRLYLNLDSPVMAKGQSATAGDYRITAPSVNLQNHPDTLSDIRLGGDARVWGTERDRFRLGVGAQLFVPSSERRDFATDGTYRAMFKSLAAGTLAPLDYAANVGFHLRPRNDSPAPIGPRGHELLFGLAVGHGFPLNEGHSKTLTLGTEMFGATALTSMFGAQTTGLEALLTCGHEEQLDDGGLLRFKAAAGHSLWGEFGSPSWRGVLSVEFSDRRK